jgi:hypothetical protein
LAKAGPGLRLNEHLEHKDGDVVFRHACQLGLEGIVSKRLGSLHLGPLARLAEDEEPSGTGGEARGGRGLGPAVTTIKKSPAPYKEESGA